MVDMDQAAAEAILQQLPLVTEQQARMLHAAWQGGDATIRKRAWQHGRQALKTQRAEGLYSEANDAVGRWIRDYATGRVGMVMDFIDFSFTDQDRMQLRMHAAPPVLDAILATLVADALPPEEFDELLAPWSGVMHDTDPANVIDTDTRGDTHP